MGKTIQHNAGGQNAVSSWFGAMYLKVVVRSNECENRVIRPVGSKR